MTFPDIMVDLETTGTSPDETAIIQIAAVRFNLQTGEVDPNVFDMCLSIPPRRYWDEGTRAWWSKMPDVLMDIWQRQRPPEQHQRHAEITHLPRRTPGHVQGVGIVRRFVQGVVGKLPARAELATLKRHRRRPQEFVTHGDISPSS